MSDTRPSGGEVDGAAQLLASVRSRLSAATADLALPGALRLSDRERITVSGLLSRLMRGIEDELRSAAAARLADSAPEAAAALASASLPIAQPILERSGAFADPALIALLLRRAEEHRLARSAPEAGLLIELSGDSDAAIAAAAVSLLVATNRRLDAFQEPMLVGGDLPAEIEHGLVWTVAAALRTYLVARHSIPASVADEAVSASAADFLAPYDEGSGVDALARRLALRLNVAGRLDDALIARSAAEGLLPLLLASLSLRLGLDAPAVWEVLAEPAGRGAALLLRAAGVNRAEAASILLAIAAREEAVAAQIDLFDTTSPEAARQLLALWRRDPAYRAALGRLAA